MSTATITKLAELTARVEQLEAERCTCPTCAGRVARTKVLAMVARHRAVRAIAEPLDRLAAIRALPMSEHTQYWQSMTEADIRTCLRGMSRGDANTLLAEVPGPMSTSIKLATMPLTRYVRLSARRGVALTTVNGGEISRADAQILDAAGLGGMVRWSNQAGREATAFVNGYVPPPAPDEVPVYLAGVRVLDERVEIAGIDMITAEAWTVLTRVDRWLGELVADGTVIVQQLDDNVCRSLMMTRMRHLGAEPVLCVENL